MTWVYSGIEELGKPIRDYENKLEEASLKSRTDDQVRESFNNDREWEEFNLQVLSIVQSGLDPRDIDDMKILPDESGEDRFYVFSQYGLNLIWYRNPVNSPPTVTPIYFYKDGAFLSGAPLLIRRLLGRR